MPSHRKTPRRSPATGWPPHSALEILRTLSVLGTDGVLLLDQARNLLWASPNIPELLSPPSAFGTARKVKLRPGTPLALLLDDPRCADIVAAALSSDQPVRGELRQNKWRRVLRAVAVSMDEGGRDPAVLLILSDITPERRLSRANRELIANLSHDLRTPLASLRLLAETLDGAARNDVEAAPLFASRIAQEAERLHALVAGLLDLARLEAGAEQATMEQVELLALSLQLAEELAPQASEREVQVSVLGEATVALADPSRLRRALANVMDNAVKFTGAKGSVTVTISAPEGSPTISVRDTGSGIGARELTRVFDRFYTGDRSRSGRSSGLGLSIAKQAVELQGGEIEVRSKLGAGTTVKITLPHP